MKSTLESQISDTIPRADSETIEETQTETQINEKLANDDDLCKDDHTVDNEGELGLIDNETNLQAAKNDEIIGENDIVQRGCEESEEKQSEVEIQEEAKDDSVLLPDDIVDWNPGNNGEILTITTGKLRLNFVRTYIAEKGPVSVS